MKYSGCTKYFEDMLPSSSEFIKMIAACSPEALAYKKKATYCNNL
jgi:hypothetical protein